MGYSDQMFYTRPLLLWGQAVSFGTTTASSVTGANATDVAPQIPTFTRRSIVNAMVLRCTVIPDAGSTALVAHFMNGTDTAGTVTLTTATADEELAFTMVAASAVIASGSQPTIKITGTSTASADAQGSYDIWAEVQELPQSA